MKIRIRNVDRLFSIFIRKRDRECVRCHSPVSFNPRGLPITHQNSHFWSRGNETTRFDERNCITLCFACHLAWGGDYRDEYKEFMIKKLGKKQFDALRVQAHQNGRKDDILTMIVIKELHKTLDEDKNLHQM